MSRYKLPSLEGRPSYARSRFSGFRLSGFALPRGVVTLLLDYLETYRQRRALAALDDHMLKDIGLSRCDVEAEISRPFWRSKACGWC